MNCVNWWEAYAFCIWDGGFLPSDAESEYAAAGGDQQRPYPWGTAAPGSANQYAIYGCNYPNAGACSGVANIAPVGTAAAGAGRWSQLDLVGDSVGVDPRLVSDDLRRHVHRLRGPHGGFRPRHARRVLQQRRDSAVAHVPDGTVRHQPRAEPRLPLRAGPLRTAVSATAAGSRPNARGSSACCRPSGKLASATRARRIACRASARPVQVPVRAGRASTPRLRRPGGRTSAACRKSRAPHPAAATPALAGVARARPARSPAADTAVPAYRGRTLPPRRRKSARLSVNRFSPNKTGRGPRGRSSSRRRPA